MCVEHINSPTNNAKMKIEHMYTGPSNTNLFDDMINCDPEGRLMVRILLILAVKLQQKIHVFYLCLVAIKITIYECELMQMLFK